jgi:hypothetical protein
MLINMWLSPVTLIVGVVIFAVVGADGCTAAKDDPNFPSIAGAGVSTTSAEPFTRLLSATTSGFTEPAELVLRDQTAFANAWRTVHNGIPGNPAPAVDFTQKMVVLVALGQRNTGGFSIQFDSLTVASGIARVRYTVTSPGNSCMTTQSLTSPVDIVVVRRLDGQPQFEARSVVKEC